MRKLVLRGMVAGLAWVGLGAGLALAAKVVPLGPVAAAESDPVAECGALVGSPFERDARGNAADDGQIFLDAALSACEAARAQSPDSAEVATWLGRVYVLLGRATEAVPLLDDAAGQGNPFAAYLMAGLLDNAVNDGVDDDSGRALDLLRQSADIGFAPAAFELGQRYETGKDVETDYAEARRLYELASGQNLGIATYRLGYLYNAGLGVDADNATAMTFYQKATEQGEPVGWFGIGQLEQYGQGVEQDYGKAVEAYRKGADAGEKMSETALAYLYEQGLGVAQDYAVSLDLLKDAAGQGYGFAQAALALHYLFGEGTEVDAGRALDLAWAAQRQGVTYAEGIVGFMLAEGLGADRDLRSALFHFQAGAQGGDQYSAGRVAVTESEIACQDAAGSPYEPGASGAGAEFDDLDSEAAVAACKAALEANPGSVGDGVWLARAYIKGGRTADALPLLEPGVGGGNVLALSLYAQLLIDGEGVGSDVARGVDLYRQAADREFAPAQLALGRIYAAGELVPRDAALAATYFRRAIENDLAAAGDDLAALDNEGQAAAGLDAGFAEEGAAY